MLIITSLFEGYLDNAVTSVKKYAPNLPTAVILYDLIPLKNSSEYLSNFLYAQYYERKVKCLVKADLLLAISEHTRSEAIETLNIAPNKIVTIFSATSLQFNTTPLSMEKQNLLKEKT